MLQQILSCISAFLTAQLPQLVVCPLLAPRALHSCFAMPIPPLLPASLTCLQLDKMQDLASDSSLIIETLMTIKQL